MEITFFLKGLALGFSIAAPVGPIGILCIRKALQYGRLSGFFSGMGAAFADAIYAAIAAFGLSVISDFLLEKQFWLRLIGGAFLLFLGYTTFKAVPKENGDEIPHTSLIGDFLSVFFLTITNPMTIVSFIAIFAGLGFSCKGDCYTEGLSLVLGVLIGSASWWLLLSEGITLFRHKLSKNLLFWINRIAGLLIAAFGVAALFSLLLY